MDNLNQVSHKLAEQMYAAGGAPGGPGPGSDRATGGGEGPSSQGDGKKDEDVIDAEFEVKDSKN